MYFGAGDFLLQNMDVYIQGRIQNMIQTGAALPEIPHALTAEALFKAD